MVHSIGGIDMREIKFRVWDSEKKKILPIQRHSFKTGKSMPYGWNIEYVFDGLMQYTGLKDKNGKEVYEGDVLLYNNDIKSIVHYKNGAFVRSYENSNIYLLYDSFITDGCLDDYEVIGNIYEDKHLLEEV